MNRKIEKIIVILSVFLSNSIYAQVEFNCDKVKLADKPLPEVTYVKAIETRIGTKFEACEFNLRDQPLVATDIHPFIYALFIAYSDHRPISISPDMIWLLICQGFSNHVNNNVETLRKEFVTFDDKQKITIETSKISLDFKKGSIKSPWPLVLPIITDSISKYVKTDIHNLYVQSFSTTTYIEKSAYEIALMDVMSGYFEYEFVTMCGIPKITIEGTTEDWLKIKNNLKKFKGYKIDNWIKALEPIIQQFVDASQNKIDHAFWSTMFKRVDESGGPYITGWMIKFFPYINYGKDSLVINPYINKEPKGFMEGLTTDNFNNGLSKVGFIWNYLGDKYEMEFLSGFIGIKQDKKTLTLRPEIGWIVKDCKSKKINTSSKENFINKKDQINQNN